MENIECKSHPVYDSSGSLVMLQIAWNRAQVSTVSTSETVIFVIVTVIHSKLMYFDNRTAITHNIGPH